VYLAIKLAKQQIAMIIVATFALSLAITPIAFGIGEDCNANADCLGNQGTDVCGAAGKCIAGAVGAVNADDDIFGINPIKDKTKLGDRDIRETVAEIINVALGLLGTIAVVIILAGGFQWMTAGGNEEKVGGAKKLIISGIIGLAIIMSAFAISVFVINNLGTATSTRDFQEIQPR
jgi:hypothetical protein